MSRYVLCVEHKHDNECFYVDESDPKRVNRVCGMNSGFHYPEVVSVEKLLAEFFQIDMKKLDDEKCEILADLRSQPGEYPTCERCGKSMTHGERDICNNCK